MKTLEQIKNDYAIGKGLVDWNRLISSFFHPNLLDIHISEVMKIYAMECLKLASENAEVDDILELNGDRYYLVNKESITNENNIIK